MPTFFFIVRATIADPAKRAAFDEWYRKEHLPDAVKSFGAQKAWRFWSESDPAVHQATYQLADRAALDGTRPARHEAAGRGFRQGVARHPAHARDHDAGRGVGRYDRLSRLAAPPPRNPPGRVAVPDPARCRGREPIVAGGWAASCSSRCDVTPYIVSSRTAAIAPVIAHFQGALTVLFLSVIGSGGVLRREARRPNSCF